MNRVSYSQIPQRVALRCFCQQNPTSVEKSLLHSFFVWKTSGGKLVATSFFYLMVHRWIADDVNIYLQFALKVTHHFKNADFDRFLLIVPQPWELAKKRSIIANRKSTMRFQSSHRWTQCVTPNSPKGGSKRKFLPARHYANAGISRRCVPVCLSVCLPHAGIVSQELIRRWDSKRQLFTTIWHVRTSKY